MDLLLASLHILASVLLIALILIQQGKGADIGATLGGGDSSSLFGPTAENPLRNATTLVAVVFMVTSVSLAYQARFPGVEEGKLFMNKSSSAASEVPGTEVSDSAARNAVDASPSEGAPLDSGSTNEVESSSADASPEANTLQ